jgi:DNA-binding IscR family transcriptional regulator
LIKSNPGVTVPQIADRMGIRQNYLYRVTAALQKQGSVKRKGQGFVAA